MNWTSFFEINLVFSILVVAYWLLLRNSDRFRWNRFILLGLAGLAFLLPLLPQPFQTQPVQSAQQQMAEFSTQKITPAGSGGEVASIATPDRPAEAFAITWFVLLQGVYWSGVLFFLIRYLIRLFRLGRFIFLSKKQKISGGYWLIRSPEPLAPFSFFHYIVMGRPEKNTPQHTQVFEHEKVHADQWHSLDVMLSEWIKIALWFNPLAYLYARLIRNNLEFLVDRTILEAGASRRLYQYHLLQASTGILSFNFTNHYNHSFLKKRIIMMNTRKKKKWTTLKLMLFVCLLFPLVQVFGQEKMNTSSKDTYVIITSDVTKAELEKLQDELFDDNAQLIFNELSFDDKDVLSAVNLKVIAKERGQLGYIFDKKLIEEKGFIPLFAIKIELPDSGGIGVGGLEAEDIDQLIADWKKWNVRTAGINATPEALKEFQKRIIEVIEVNKRRKANMPPDRFADAKTREGRTTYRLDDESLNHAINKIQTLSRENNLTPVYYVDGLAKNVTLDDFDPEELDKVELVTKYVSTRDGNDFKVKYTDLLVYLTRKL